MAENEAYLSLLNQKKELVFKLLRMSNDTELGKADVAINAEKYIGFVEARDKIINELKELNSEINRLEKPSGAAGDAVLIDREIKEMTAQIARMELGIRKKAVGIKARLHQEINQVKNQKKENGIYDAAALYDVKV